MDITILADNIINDKPESNLEKAIDNMEWDNFQNKFQSEVLHTSAKQNEKKIFNHFCFIQDIKVKNLI